MRVPGTTFCVQLVMGRCGRCLMLLLCCSIAAPLDGKQRESGKVEPASNQVLRQELMDMQREDQTARIGAMQVLQKQGISIGDSSQLKDPKTQQILKAEGKKTELIDSKHRRRLTEIIKEQGWPGKSLVGRDGAGAAWLIVQHSDSDVRFQRKCLSVLEAAPAGEVEVTHIAYLNDRVLVNEGKPQRYGTQLGENFVPRPIADAENVDKRRAKIGLPPLAEYIRTAKEAYEKIASGEADSKESNH